MERRSTASLILVLLPLLFLACGDSQVERWERQDAFVYAAADGNLKKVKELYANGVDVNAPAGFDSHLTAPALTLASGGGHLDTVKFLLERGADVNVRDGHWNGTPLMTAAWSGHEEIVRLLIAYGADVNAVNSEGASALSKASDERHPHPKVIEILKQAGAKE